MNCETCKFWMQWDHQPAPHILLGDCRKHSPIIMQGDDRMMTKWPSTKSEDWCGSYKANAETRSANEASN